MFTPEKARAKFEEINAQKAPKDNLFEYVDWLFETHGIASEGRIEVDCYRNLSMEDRDVIVRRYTEEAGFKKVFFSSAHGNAIRISMIF